LIFQPKRAKSLVIGNMINYVTSLV